MFKQIFSSTPLKINYHTGDYEYIQTFYQLAKEKNKIAISRIIESGICINLIHHGEDAVYLAAKNGDEEAVMFLITEFGASTIRAICGAAEKFHINLLRALLIRCQSTTSHQQAVLFAIEYATYGGHSASLNDLFDRPIALSNDQRLLFAIRGAARSKDRTFVNNALLHFNNDERGREHAIAGAAWGGDDDYVKTTIEKLNWLESRTKDKLITLAVGFAGSSGNIQLVEWLLKNFPGATNINWALYNATSQGQLELVEHFATRVNLESVAKGAAAGAHIKLLNELIATNQFHFLYLPEMTILAEELSCALPNSKIFDYLPLIDSCKLREALMFKIFDTTEKISTESLNTVIGTIQPEKSLNLKSLGLKQNDIILVKFLTENSRRLKNARIKYNIITSQAYALFNFRLHHWFLQAKPFFEKQYGLPFEVFVKITSYATDLNETDVADLYAKYTSVRLNEFFANTVKRSPKSFFTCDLGTFPIYQKNDIDRLIVIRNDMHKNITLILPNSKDEINLLKIQEGLGNIYLENNKQLIAEAPGLLAVTLKEYADKLNSAYKDELIAIKDKYLESKIESGVADAPISSPPPKTMLGNISTPFHKIVQFSLFFGGIRGNLVPQINANTPDGKQIQKAYN